MVEVFTGAEDIEVGEWVKKVKLVCTLRKLEVQEIIPLFLGGPAFSIYDQMVEKEKTNPEAIVSALVKAFGKEKVEAYEELKRLKWSQGISAEVFLSQVRRIVKSTGIEGEEIVKLSFVTGLPTRVSSLLRATTSIGDVSAAELVSKTRALLQEMEGKEEAVMAAYINRKCYNCGRPGHVSRNCREPDSKGRSPLQATVKGPRRPGGARDPICFRCGKQGHYAKWCAEELSMAGNDLEGAAM